MGLVFWNLLTSHRITCSHSSTSALSLMYKMLWTNHMTHERLMFAHMEILSEIIMSVNPKGWILWSVCTKELDRSKWNLSFIRKDTFLCIFSSYLVLFLNIAFRSLNICQLLLEEIKTEGLLVPLVTPAPISGTRYHNIFIYHPLLMLSNATLRGDNCMLLAHRP